MSRPIDRYPLRVTDVLPVVTVTYSPGPHLERFLASLSLATERPVSVLLADNGPQGRTLLHAIQNCSYLDFVRELKSESEADEVLKRGDVQFVINPALGVSASLSALDLNQDGVVNVVDVQTVINAVLGPGCLAK